jgi:oligopeptidase B
MTLTPPTANKVPFTFQQHTHTLADEYAWLQNKSDPEVLAYLEAENAYARSVLEPTEALQEQLYQEMRGRIQEDETSVPARYGEYYYYRRIQAGQQYKVYCRRKGSPDGPEEVLVNENALAEGLAYCRVFLMLPSPDNRYLAYSVDTTGSWVFDLYIKDLTTGLQVAGPIPMTAWGAGWASDSRTLFYTVFNESHRPFQVWRFQVGGDSSQGVLVYHETDDSFNASIQRTRSGAYLLLTSASATTSEVRYLRADQPVGEFQVIEPRFHWREYYAEHHDDYFWIRTNDEAENFKLVKAPVSSPGKANWQEVLPHRGDVLLEDFEPFRDRLVVLERQGGLKQIRLSAPDGVSGVRYVTFPEPVYTIDTADNFEFAAQSLRIFYSSLVTPESTVDVGLLAENWQVLKVRQIPSGYDASLYVTERLHAAVSDGAQVPMSIFYKKGTLDHGPAPLMMEGYGSYGYSREPGFDQRRLCLVDRGFVFVLAHVRGGSELGRAWYEQGRLMHKMNTFTDFIACAESLVARGYTTPEKLAIQGGSAGGLLVTAVTNLRPDLFKAVVAMVPFTNVITAMLDPDLPLTVVEWEQWGDPADPVAFDYMLSYSPYENVQAKAYPNLYVKAGLNDLQVPYWDPAKYVARLRAHKTDTNRLLFVVNMGAGHGGASGRYDHLREDAQVYAFLLDTLSADG